MTQPMEKGGAGVTIVVIVIILIIAGALFFMNRGDATDVMIEDENTAPAAEVQGDSVEILIEGDAEVNTGAAMEDGAVAQ